MICPVKKINFFISICHNASALFNQKTASRKGSKRPHEIHNNDISTNTNTLYDIFLKKSTLFYINFSFFLIHHSFCVIQQKNGF